MHLDCFRSACCGCVLVEALVCLAASDCLQAGLFLINSLPEINTLGLYILNGVVMCRFILATWKRLALGTVPEPRGQELETLSHQTDAADLGTYQLSFQIFHKRVQDSPVDLLLLLHHPVPGQLHSTLDQEASVFSTGYGKVTLPLRLAALAP